MTYQFSVFECDIAQVRVRLVVEQKIALDGLVLSTTGIRLNAVIGLPVVGSLVFGTNLGSLFRESRPVHGLVLVAVGYHNRPLASAIMRNRVRTVVHKLLEALLPNG